MESKSSDRKLKPLPPDPVRHQHSAIALDDIGEGLDFDRASRLVALLIQKAKRFNFQLIMTTNDSFIMNGVPIEYLGGG